MKKREELQLVDMSVCGLGFGVQEFTQTLEVDLRWIRDIFLVRPFSMMRKIVIYEIIWSKFIPSKDCADHNAESVRQKLFYKFFTEYFGRKKFY